MARNTPKQDPRGVIADAYQISDISAQECRSIFLDWALEPRSHAEMQAAAAQLHKAYKAQYPGHPMTELLLAASTGRADAPRRKGGRKSRLVT